MSAAEGRGRAAQPLTEDAQVAVCTRHVNSLLFASLLFTAICKAAPDSHFAFLHFFSMGMVLIPLSCTMSRTSFHSSSGTLSIRSRPLNPGKPSLAGACWAQTEDPSGCGTASPSQGRWLRGLLVRSPRFLDEHQRPKQRRWLPSK